MLDIHCHILPTIDDGPQTLVEALEMAKLAVSEGITEIIATPHHLNGSYENPKAKIKKEVQLFNEALQEAAIPLVVLPGQETRIYGEMVADIDKDNILTLADGNRFIFIELPSNHVPRYTSQLIYDIQLKGLTPVLVHPERNSEIVETPDLLYKLVKNGALTQITAASVVGKFGTKIKKFSNELINYNLAHFIASDAHNTTSRSFHLRDAFEQIGSEHGSSVRYYFQENAELLVAGKHIYTEPPEKIKKRKFLGVF